MSDQGSIRRRQEALAVLLLAVLTWLAPRPAAAIFGDSDEEIGLDGSLRTLGAATSNYWVSGQRLGPRSDGQSQTLLRLVLAGHPTEWLSYEVHALQSLTLQTRAIVLGSAAGTNSGLRYRAFDGRWRWYDGSSVKAWLTCDRFNVKLALPFADVTLGRQAITFGKAYFWNPLDVFLAFDPTAFDRDYKRGVDALKVDVPIGDFSGITLVGVLGRPDGGHAGYRSAGVLRVFTNFLNWDFAVQGGKVYGGFHAGLAAAGELGPVEVRAEAAYFWPLPDLRPDNAADIPEGLTAVIGVGRMMALFDRTLTLQAEYLFNSAAGSTTLRESFDLVSKGLMLQASEHLLGAVVTYEITSLIRGSFATVFSMSDQPSVILQPGLGYSAADEVDLLAGAMIALGDRPTLDHATGLSFRSEYGTYPHFFYFEVKVYF